MERIYRYSILFIAFILPSPFYGFTLAVLAGVFICWLYNRDFKNILTEAKQPQVLLPLALYFLIAAGVFYAEHTGKALSGLSTQISYALFPIIIGTSSIVNKKLLDRAKLVFTISTCFFIFIAIGFAIFDTFRTGEQTVLVGESLYSTYKSFGLTRVFENWHPTYVSMFANLSIAFLIQQCINHYTKRNLIITVILVCFLFICQVLLNSLIAFIALFFILVYYVFSLSKYLNISNKLKQSALLIIFLGAFCFFYYNPFKIEKISSLKNREFKVTDNQSERNLLTMRMAKWSTHVDIFKKNLLAGATYGDINFERKETYEAKGYNDLAQYNYNAHNQYLEIFATYGIIGGLLFLSMLFTPLLHNRKYSVLIPFLLITTITFLTESILVRQQGILFFMFFYALYTHRNSHPNQIITK
jgi:O-antigen ligase